MWKIRGLNWLNSESTSNSTDIYTCTLRELEETLKISLPITQQALKSMISSILRRVENVETTWEEKWESLTKKSAGECLKTNKHTEVLWWGRLPVICALQMKCTYLSKFSSQDLQLSGSQVTERSTTKRETEPFTFLSPHHPHFSGNEKVDIVWSPGQGSAQSRIHKCPSDSFQRRS